MKMKSLLNHLRGFGQKEPGLITAPMKADQFVWMHPATHTLQDHLLVQQ